MSPHRELDEDTLRRQLAAAAELIDPQPPTREDLDALRRRARRAHSTLRAGAPLAVAAGVVAIAAAGAVALQHRSEPLPPATRPPGPSTAPSTSPVPSSAAPSSSAANSSERRS